MAVVNLAGYRGSVDGLVLLLRRGRLDPVAVSASDLLRQCREQWEDDPVDQVADDLPLVAWALHLKGRALLAEDLGDGEAPEPEPPAAWVAEAGRRLFEHWRATPQGAGGPSRWPDPVPPPPADATPWRLALAWPPGRPPRRPARATVVVVPPRALWRRAAALLRRLRRHPEGIDFAVLTAAANRAERVEAFAVVLALWGRRRLWLGQTQPFGPLRIRWLRTVQGVQGRQGEDGNGGGAS
jgi:chromatin segregation and condensation protein Rec8/ScpA/Scc1 (kleisin family)